MPDSKGKISRWQQLCLGFLALLSPIIRLLPQQSAHAADSSAWVAAIVGAIPVGLLFLLTARLMKNALPDEGFGELFLRILGRTAGKIVILLFTVWLIFYAGFSLRSGAERYIATAYNHAQPSFFILVLLLLSVAAALSRFKALGRTAEVFFPIMALLLGLVFGFCFPDVETQFLPPPTFSETGNILLAAVPVANIMGLSVYFGFLEGRVGERNKLKRFFWLWLPLLTAAVLLLCVTTIGTLGAEMTSQLEYPFFVMVRNISVFNFLERLESAVMALWVVTDFLLISILMFIVSDNLRLCLGLGRGGEDKAKLLDMKNGRWTVWLCAALVLVAALTMAPDSEVLLTLSRAVVPYINIALTFLLLPAIVVVGLIRKRI